ncbi:MAG TPA: alkyl hydroperoxide reductase [Gemmatimonadaceae bacterium]|nr:alkyl hydroperoxide reductase [Gemmatimonadaceae bacterium]
MRELELRYPSELVVIGVHSGKYHAERVTPRIRDASIRLDAAHPVVNDRQFRIWRSYAVSAWPTLVAIDPAGYVVGTHAGEFTSEMLVPFIDDLIAKANNSGTMNEQPLHFEADPPTVAPGRLRYPGKVVVRDKTMAIADSGNNRVIIGSLDEMGMSLRVERTIGDGTPGFRDGLDARFRSPQGMAFGDGVLYVADAENHAIRSVNLETGEVTTLAGTGRQMRTRGDQQAGAMSSPWDVALSGGTLFVAMAGIHQIWSVDIATGKSRVRYGTGGEDIRDGDEASALLAQPMGIAIEKERLYFTDSESSAVRWADVAEGGVVGTVVGTGLFDFGDVDGTGDEVRLQHTQGIASHSSGRLLIADSYNDCLKWVDPETRAVKTWGGGFHEPGGVCFGSSHAYVADTNAHRIAVVHIDTRDVTELRIE